MWNESSTSIVAADFMKPHDAVETWTASSARDLLESIREAIETLSCGDEYPTVRATAEFVGMSVRTLQRRLAQAGTSHQMLVAQARFATAAEVLERSESRILELALDLGYSDHANFTRAFRRWAGCAPREYRSGNTPPLPCRSTQGFAGREITPADRRASEQGAQ